MLNAARHTERPTIPAPTTTTWPIRNALQGCIQSTTSHVSSDYATTLRHTLRAAPWSSHSSTMGPKPKNRSTRSPMHRQLRFEPRSHHEQDREVDEQIEQSGQREDFNNCERLAHQAFSQAGNLENRDGRCETGLLDNDSDLVRIRRERQAKRDRKSDAPEA